MTSKSLAQVAGSRDFPRKDTDKFSGSLPKSCLDSTKKKNLV